MLPLKGLFTDSKLLAQPKDTYRNARNIVLSKYYNSIINENGFTPTAVGYPASLATPIGVTMFPDQSYILYSQGTSGLDRIGIVDINGNYTDLIVDNGLNFDINFPVTSSEIDYNYKKDRITGWVTGNNPPRVLNIDTLPFALNIDKSLVDPTIIIDLEVFPKVLTPNFTASVSNNGGSLLAGNYSFSCLYSNIDGTKTSYTAAQLNINIINDPTATGFITTIDGVVPGTQTSKSITLNITNVDTRYDNLILVGISRINGITTFFQIKTIHITGSTITTTYVGTEGVTIVPSEEFLQVLPLYTSAQAITQYNNELYLANLQSQPDIDYQHYANQIRVYYNTNLVGINDTIQYKNNFPAGFAHGETYALYIELILNNGSTSRAFHIPGRVSQFNDKTTSSLATTEGMVAKRFQVEDTTNSGSFIYTTRADGTIGVSVFSQSNMGYWENQDEVYPANFPDLAGQPVRHHTFPTIQKCSQVHYSANTLYGQSYLDVLGIDVANVIIPTEILPLIQGYRILYAKRDYNNSRTLGTDILLYASKSSFDSNLIWSSGGNWNTQLSVTPSLGTEFIVRTDYLRGHSFELMKDKPQLSNSTLYMDLEVKITKTNQDLMYGNLQIAGGVGGAGGNLVASGNNSGTDPGVVVDFSYPFNVTTNKLSSQVIKKLGTYRYLPSGILDGENCTVKGEECIQANIVNGSVPLANPISVSTLIVANDNKVNGNVASGPGPTWPYNSGNNNTDTYLITYKQLKVNCYNNYDSQTLNTLNQVIFKSGGSVPTTATNLRGGDIFVGVRSFVCVAPFVAQPTDTTIVGSFSATYAHTCESRYNVGLRYEVIGDITTKYYPKENPFYLWNNPDFPQQSNIGRTFNRAQPNVNGYGYSQDYNAVNDINQPIIYNPAQISTDSFPYRVIRSGEAGTNSQSIRSWKTYLVADFYEANRNKGTIINIAVLDDVLLIHHQYGLFRTVGKERILTSTTEVYLGSGDIFSQNPKDVIPSKIGYLGVQNIFSCIQFKGGYAWQNQLEGRVYIMTSDGPEEISDNGQVNFFLDNLQIDNTLPDNPFLGEGLISGYDRINNRLLFTKRGDSPFTLSYSLDYKCWGAFHDYFPDMYFFNNSNFFCISGNAIFICDSDTKKATYTDGVTIYPSYIDCVFSSGTDNILIETIEWISEVYDATQTLQKLLTITSVEASNSYQDTDEIPIVPFTSFGVASNTRAKVNKWHFNKVRDVNADVYKASPLVDRYVLVRYKYDNHTNLDSSQNSLYLYDLGITARKAEK